MLEACLITTIFLTLVFGLCDTGWELFFHHTLMNQARSAARYGAVNPGSTPAIQNVALYNATTGSGPGVFGLTAANVNVTRSGTPGGTDDRIVVTITGYHYTLVTFVWAGAHAGRDIIIGMPVEN